MNIGYRVKVQGIMKENKSSISLNNKYIENITIEILEPVEKEELFSKLIIKFYLTDTVTNKEKAIKITEPILNSIINLMIYKFSDSNIAIDRPKLHSYYSQDEHMLATAEITLYNLPTYEMTEEDINWIQNKIKDQNLTNKLEHNASFIKYKSISIMEDEVARYLLLYSLLYDLKGPNQRNVDKYIQSKEPDVAKRSTTKKGKKGYETSYTWWRNQAQHMEPETDIEEIKHQFSKLIESLQIFVLEAIRDQINESEHNN